MRNYLLAGASLLALFAWAQAAQAATFDFTFTGSLVTFTVPVTGTYQIVAFGAQGGGNPTWSSGLGAEIGDDFGLTAGEKLQIAVGGAGGDGNIFSLGGGGGGGSFVVGTTPLVIAGGGGGAGEDDGGGGRTGGNGGDGGSGDGFAGGLGGTNGSGGGAPRQVVPPTGLSGGGGGGGGFNGSGGNGGSSSNGGGSFPGLAGGSFVIGTGGFGGGGGAGEVQSGGGGGGYSGGGGGWDAGGGGGGSFDAGQKQALMAGIRSGNGEVVITYVFAGTPGTANCLGKSVSALASQKGGLSHAAAALGYASVRALQDAISAYCADVPG